MGVPAFFKWLTLRYPKIVMDAIEEVNTDFDINNFLKTKYNSDTSMPFIDNFYLDMNGIIHPCCHPQDRPQPTSEQEMFDAIFDYTDKLIKVTKPQKLIYLAIDGVAPRAKMNQQRSRRFRAAQEAKEKTQKESELLEEWESKGLVKPECKEQHGFDSNVITPGTTFMHRLAQALKTYIAHRLQFDPLWKGLTVIFSDSNVPGEGEHKILEFIRVQRLQDHYDPNTKHCIYGADADLIMLSLITHEPHFFIIRESLNENMWKKCEFCGGNGHIREDCRKLLNPEEPPADNTSLIHSIEFSILKVHIVREYLELEFRNINLPFECDPKLKFERFIDDFVFLCFFVGNDFIPHLPSLKIREGAIDALLYLYKKVIPTLDGFLTEGNGNINLARTEKLFHKLALVEDEIFKKQLYAKNRDLQRKAHMAYQEGRLNKDFIQDEVVREFMELKKPAKEVQLSNNEEIQLFDDIIDDIEEIINNEENPKHPARVEKEKREKLNKGAADNFQRVLKEVLKKESNKKMEGYQDPVRLGEEGWKARYYSEKFRMSHVDSEFKSLIRKSYIEGICWVFSYYYNGCASWEWYYPFHYAPFASDLCDIKDLEVDFKLGLYFQPVEQLLSVLPPYSSHALPECLRVLMHDPCSELADFYPNAIRLDINGQAFAWMGVNLIPFIDENRIRKAVAEKIHLFSEDESLRNRFGETIVFFKDKEHFISKYVGNNHNNIGFQTEISFPNFRVFSGKVRALDDPLLGLGNTTHGKTFKCPIRGLKISEIKNCEIVTMVFENPPAQQHAGMLRKGVILPPKVVMEDNLDAYSKRNFRGDEAIDIVRRTLGYSDDVEQNVRGTYFDYSYNNNRAIEYNPNDLELLRKKRYHEVNEAEGDNRGFRRDAGGRDNNNNNQRYDNRNRNYDDRRNYDNRNYDNRNRNYDNRNFDNRNRNYDNRNYDNRNRNYDNRNYDNRNYDNRRNDYNQDRNRNTGYSNTNVPNVPGNVNYNQFNDPNAKFTLDRLTSLVTPVQNNQEYNKDKEQNKSRDQNNTNNQSANTPNNQSTSNINDTFNNMIKVYQTYMGNTNKKPNEK